MPDRLDRDHWHPPEGCRDRHHGGRPTLGGPDVTDLTTQRLADQVRTALNSGDVARMTGLLHRDVQWGAADDPNPSCKNRAEVLAWYTQRQGEGVSARVTDVTAQGDKILLGVRVARSGADGEVDRWQVMT